MSILLLLAPVDAEAFAGTGHDLFVRVQEMMRQELQLKWMEQGVINLLPRTVELVDFRKL